MDDYINTPTARMMAVDAAVGRMPFHVLLRGGQVADLVTGQLRPADVGLAGPLIASVHPPGARDDAAEVIDIAGNVVVPGLIDTHLHVESSMVTPSTYEMAVVPRGVTTIVWDPHEFANTCGLPGVRFAAVAATEYLRKLVLAPSCVPSAPGLESTGADLGAEQVAEMLRWPELNGVAEVMDMAGVVSNSDRMVGVVQAGVQSGKLVCGHARGLRGAELNAYAAAGVTSDHEVTSASDLREKLEAGLTIELRGSHDHLLPEFVAELNRLPQFPATVTLCTDDVFPDDLEERGGLDDVVRRLVRYGLPPMHALLAACHNAAVRIRRPDLGLVAPGRRADLVVLEELDGFRVRGVFCNGDRAAWEDESSLVPMRTEIPAEMQFRKSSTQFTAEDFRIACGPSTQALPTIVNPRFTEWGECSVTVRDGFAVRPEGVTLMAVVNRYDRRTPPRLALLEGWGEWRGAFATTVSHDSHNLTVFGSDAADMSVAANHVAGMGGGLSVVAGGELLAQLPLAVAGIVSAAPLAEVASAFRDVKRAMAQIVDWEPPRLTFKSCFGASLACNAGPHLTDLGIVDKSRSEVLVLSSSEAPANVPVA